MKGKELIIILCVLFKVNAYLQLQRPGSALDHDLYESVLDPELCERQIKYLQRNNTALLLQFLDAGLRIPKGILGGNFADYGNYHQCLAIKRQFEEDEIEGKYCSISIDSFQNISNNYELNNDELNFDPAKLINIYELQEKNKNVNIMNAALHVAITGTTTSSETASPSISFSQAVCIPKTCTPQQALRSLFKIRSAGLQFSENFCRLKNDKPWVAADYVALSIFSVIGILTFLSTAYDLNHIFILKRDPNQVNTLYRCCSIYTNTKTLFTFSNSAKVITCLDGIRAFAMAWVILGHAAATTNLWLNPIEAFQWAALPRALWITAAPITVDTFFALSGILVVYTTAGKFSGMDLLKNLHLYYLNRLLRMFPLLATAILLQTSVWNRMLDGPMWGTVAEITDRCRQFWWSTLLYIQNYVNPEAQCLPHSWYLAIDVQLHILSPIVLYWVLLNKKFSAWISLTISLTVSLTATTVYCFIMKFPGGVFRLNRPGDSMFYMINYYMNTLPRSPPFFVGLVIGYILHLNRNRKAHVPKILVALLWACAITIAALVFYSTYLSLGLDWNNQTVDSLINSFSRPAWALALGWLIFACIHGYSGPVNWFLSLQIWRLPARLSYAMYLFHYPLMFVDIGTRLTPSYFSVVNIWMEFLKYFSLNLILAAVLTVLIDTPFSILCKMLLSRGSTKTKKTDEETITPMEKEDKES